MDQDLGKLYKSIEIYKIFENTDMCQDCSVSCNSPKWISWLLPAEVEAYKNHGFNVTQEYGANFFKDGQCHLYEKGVGCTIHEHSDRGLECRLTPITFLNHNGEPWWILLNVCTIVKNSSQEEINSIIERAMPLIPEMENNITPQIFEDIKQICDAIEKFANPQEGIDYIKIKALKK